MRDLKRIVKILKQVQEIWEQFPDLRLGQLIQNLGDVYHLEDDKLIEELKKTYFPNNS